VFAVEKLRNERRASVTKVAYSQVEAMITGLNQRRRAARGAVP